MFRVHSALSPCGVSEVSEETGVFTFWILWEGLADMDYFYSGYSSTRAQRWEQAEKKQQKGEWNESSLGIPSTTAT